MSEESKRILQMLSEGKMSVNEAERLLAALGANGPSAENVQSEQAPRRRPKYLRVVVDADDSGEDGPAKVNIRVPMQLLRAGVRLGTLIPAEAREHMNEAMRERGIGFDLSQLKPENVDELIDQLNDLTVDVDQGKNKVHVFCE